MIRGLRQGLLWIRLTAAVLALATLTVASTAGAQEAKLRLEAPSGDIGPADPPFTVDVVVEDVVNLGAFEFDLHYDSSILGFVNVERGPFLGSSGRRVECLDPRLEPGSLRFVCVTLGALPPGADGSGVLATVTLAPAGPGTSPLRFYSAILARPDGQPIAAALQDASITVASPGTPGTPAATGTSNDGGTNWPLWGSLFGGAAVLVVAAAGVAWWSRAQKQP